MDFEVATNEHLYVKFGSEYSEENDDVVIVPEAEGEINIAWFLYEFIALTIPLKHVHPAGKCNKTMSMKLKNILLALLMMEMKMITGFLMTNLMRTI